MSLNTNNLINPKKFTIINNKNPENNKRNNSFFSKGYNSTRLNETNKQTNYSSIDNRTTVYKTGYNSTNKNFDVTMMKSTINVINEINEDKEKNSEKNFNKNLGSTLSSLKSKKFEGNFNDTKFNSKPEKEKEIFSNNNSIIEENNDAIKNKFEKVESSRKINILNLKKKSATISIKSGDENLIKNHSTFIGDKNSAIKIKKRQTKQSSSMFIKNLENSNKKENANFNKTFLSTSSSGIEYQPHLLHKINLLRHSQNDFFTTQTHVFKNKNKNNSTERNRIFLPSLMSGVNDIEKEMTDINVNLSQAVKEINKQIGSKKEDKYEKEFTVENRINDDVFLYGKNGTGYYTSKKIKMNDTEILKKIDCENLLKHQKFFNKRFDLEQKKKVESKQVFGRNTENNFRKVLNYLKDTEELKLRAIKTIENHQLKNLMEALKENKELEDEENDDSYY